MTNIPPIARKETKETSIHSQMLEDDYAWLKDKENPDVIAYLDAENAFTEEMTKHLKDKREQLFLELKGRIKETDETYPHRDGDYYYYTRTEEGKQYTIHCRKLSIEGEEEIILDENAEAEDKKFFSVRSIAMSPDHRLMAYSVDTTGYEKYTLNIVELSTNNLVDTIADVSGQVVWGSDDILFYTVNDDIHRPYRVLRHKLGVTDTDEIIFSEDDTKRFVGMDKTEDSRYLFIYSDSITSSEVHIIDLVTMGDLQCFKRRVENYEYELAHHDRYFYITTNDNATNFMIYRTAVNAVSRENWEVFIPHSPETRIFGMTVLKHYLLIHKRIEGLRRIEVIDLQNEKNSHEIEFPEPIYALQVHDNWNKVYDDHQYMFGYSSLSTPSTTYSHDFRTRELTLLKQKEIKNLDPSQYLVRREYGTAEDGAKIPISIVHKKGITNAPTLLYGYGSYGYTIDPGFNPNYISLLDRGMVFAIAHIRGGSINGRQWYEDGKMLRKRNTFTDFIACAEYMLNCGLTARNKLSIMGGSAGGLLVGAVINMRPDLFRSVVAAVPFVDVINTMMDDSIPLTTHEYEEWGNPNDQRYFEYMLSYSPYDNVERKEYPAMLVTAGLNDPRVHFWEPAKWTAKLRAHKTDDNLLILKTNMGAGHGGASGRYDYLKEVAFNYSFLLDSLGLEI